MRLLLGAVLVLALLVPSSAVAADPLVRVGPIGRTAFSPNGDGRADTVPVPFRLDERAHVSVLVRPLGRVIDLGVRDAGRHRWHWDGGGAPNGAYRLVVRARTDDGRTGRAVRWAEIDSGESLAAVRIRMTRPAVYPQTPGKDDVIVVHSTKEGNATGVTLRDASGEVVLRDDFRQWWTWDGGGLPVGEYDATFSLTDKFGNRRSIERTLRVSGASLVQETWSTTVDAGEVRRFRSSECAPEPSTRFPDGVTVPSAGCHNGFFIPRFDLPVPVDPDLTYRLTVSGGPTEAGGDDTALVVVRDVHDIVETPTGSGDATTVSAWGSPHPYLWDRPQEPLGWVRTTGGASYDVATVTLELRSWVPPR